MDLVPSVKEKLNYFRIKELKDVLTQLHLSKQGKKQDLVDRILSVLSDEQVSKMWAKKNAGGKEQVAKLVDDTYRKMQISGATDLASKGQGASDSSSIKVKGEIDDSFQPDTKIRCLCGSRLETEDLVKCDDPRCQVWQHISCVIIPDKPTEGIPPVPDKFYCELCRLTRADPFWVAVAHPLLPVKLTTTSNPTDGTNPVQSVERTFQLTRADKDLVSKPEFDVEAWCMLLNDKVPFRMQWPQYTDLQVNGVPVRATNRPGSQLLGANGRDDGPIITPYTKDGINKISLTGCDARIFCLGVRIVRRRSIQQILNLIPKESDGELFEDALARVCRCVGGGNADGDADSDSDLEVVSDTFSVNLRCPMSGSRMKIAGRFKPCIHMGCFDLEVFVEMNQRSRKWQCPVCLKNYALENIIIDPYFNRITSMMLNCGEETTEVEVKPDGSWRVKTKGESERQELGSLAQWHLPDGSPCVSADGDLKRVDTLALKQVKQEGVFDTPTGLKLGIRKNRNGDWEVSKPQGTNTSSGNKLKAIFGNPEQVVIPMSSSATGSGRDGDDPSVNQGGGGHIDYSTANGVEMDSLCLNNVDLTYDYTGHGTSAQVGGAEVIVLSDSEEDNDLLVSPPIAYRNNQNDATDGYSVQPPVMVDSYADDHNLGGNLNAIVARIPPPEDTSKRPLRALIFDSYYDPYRGVIVYFRVVDGSIKKGDRVYFMASGKDYFADEIGVLSPNQLQVEELYAGEVGYLSASIRTVADARVGDTITHYGRKADKSLPGYEEATPMVFCGLFPVDADQFPDLRDALEKLQLNDAALKFEPETSSAMGFGFRCGFLGLLHMEIVQERLEREYNLSLITTAPSVVYRVNCVNGDTVECSNPSLLPEPGQRKSIEEPFVKIEMLTPKDYIGSLMELAQERRGQFKELKFIAENRASIVYELPLAEMVGDFFDQLKSRSKGYASMEYTFVGYIESNLIKLDIRINGDCVEPLATIVHNDKAYSVGRALTLKLKELIPRQMFKVPIQACIGSKVIASEAISAIRKDVLAKCYGGDITRKKKLLKKQAEGKKRMKSIGKVDVPQEAFMAVLKLEKEVI